MDALASHSQADVIRGLLQPQCYPHDVERVERIETHISIVLLAGRFAYKIKKPVDLGFLDFTTLQLRHHFCLEELRLNRRLAPRLYLDVVAIVGSASKPQVVLRDAPDAIEYAVRMTRFPQAALLDHLLANGELAAQQVDALAETVAAFHSRLAGVGEGRPSVSSDRSAAFGTSAASAASTSSAESAGYGTPAGIATPMRQNFDQIRPLLESAEEIAALERLEAWSIAAHEALAPFMAERRDTGFVRECHGDLHLGNIVWLDGEIQVFDCIEFNPALRWIDVASEVAFTVMDLAARGRPDWGARFLDSYLEITGDYAAVRLLPYYLVYRAMVRAKVARIRATQTGTAEFRDALADYADHIRLADSFSIRPSPALIITRGVSGSGKTTVAQSLLERLGAVRLRSDVVRKRLHGLRRNGKSGSSLGSGLYSNDISRETYAELQRLAKLVLVAGYPVVVDATFLQRSQRKAFRDLAETLAVPFLLVELHAAEAELRHRIKQRRQEGNDASEADLDVLQWQLRNEEALDALESDNALVIDTQRSATTSIVAQVCQRLSLLQAHET